jgi:hypothetical protein
MVECPGAVYFSRVSRSSSFNVYSLEVAREVARAGYISPSTVRADALDMTYKETLRPSRRKLFQPVRRRRCNAPPRVAVPVVGGKPHCSLGDAFLSFHHRPSA